MGLVCGLSPEPRRCSGQDAWSLLQQLVTMAVTLELVGKVSTLRYSCRLWAAAGGGGVGIDIKIGLGEERKHFLPHGGGGCRQVGWAESRTPLPRPHPQTASSRPKSLLAWEGQQIYHQGQPLLTGCSVSRRKDKTKTLAGAQEASSLGKVSTAQAQDPTLGGGSRRALVAKPSSWVTWSQGVGFCIIPFRRCSHIEETIIE